MDDQSEVLNLPRVGLMKSMVGPLRKVLQAKKLYTYQVCTEGHRSLFGVCQGLFRRYYTRFSVGVRSVKGSNRELTGSKMPICSAYDMNILFPAEAVFTDFYNVFFLFLSEAALSQGGISLRHRSRPQRFHSPEDGVDDDNDDDDNDNVVLSLLLLLF